MKKYFKQNNLKIIYWMLMTTNVLRLKYISKIDKLVIICIQVSLISTV